MKKKQALMKNEMDKRMAELVKFSQSFKVCGHRRRRIHRWRFVADRFRVRLLRCVAQQAYS